MRREKSSPDLSETLGSQQMKLPNPLPCGRRKGVWGRSRPWRGLGAAGWAREATSLLWTLYPAPSKGAGDHALHCRLSPVIQISSLKEVNQTSLPCFTCTCS